jgi:DNA-binding FadR family transcriptional regulator
MSGVEYHRRLLEVLRRGEGDVAEGLMREHLKVSALNYLKAKK